MKITAKLRDFILTPKFVFCTLQGKVIIGKGLALINYSQSNSNAAEITNRSGVRNLGRLKLAGI